MTSALAQGPLDEALRFFTARTGLAFPGQRRRDFDAGAHRAMARHGLREPGDLAESLRRDRRVLDEMVADLTVHESYFFREPAQFDALRQIVLPRLRDERPDGSALQIWSAGCARGEEPYSLAILLEEEGLLARARIRATDISRPALTEAGRGRFSGWSFRGTKAALDQRYFERRGAAFHLQPRLRDRVTFEVLNLAAGPYAPPPGAAGYDLIFCRNVLIYFEAPLVKKIAGWFHEALRDGGWLITAPADPPLWDLAPFQIHGTPGGVIYRKGEREGARHALPATTSASATPVDTKPAPAWKPQPRPRPRTPRLPPSAADGVAAIKSLADTAGSAAAVRKVDAAIAREPMDPGLHYLRAVLLLDLSQADDALVTVRQALYLDRKLIVAHLLLGSLLRGRGDTKGAGRAYRNALRACAGRRPDELAELAEGAQVEQLAEVAAAQVAELEGAAA